LGAALVALLIIAAEPSFQSSAATESRLVGESLVFDGLGIQLSATSETRAGEAPIIGGQNSTRFVAEVLTPRLGLELRRPDLILQVFYGARFFWEDPTPNSAQSSTTDPVTRIRPLDLAERSQWTPLILHTVGLDLSAHPSRRVFLTGSGAGSIGSPDYTVLPQLLGTVQGTLPPIVDIASADVNAKARFKATRRWSYSLAGHLFYWQWLDVPTSLTAPTTMGQTLVAGQTFVTGQTLVSVTPDAEFVLTPRDRLSLGATFAAASYSNGIRLSTVTPTLTWATRVNPRTNLRLTGGVAYANVSGSPPPGSASLVGTTVAPIGSFELFSELARHNQVLVQGDLTGGVDLYVDPVLNILVSRGSAGGRLTLISAPLWMTSLRGDFGTALRRTPYQVTLNGVPVAGVAAPDETAFSITLSVRRWMSENLLAEVGGLWGDRGPALVTPGFEFHQRQLWVYLALTATTRPIARLAY
jgi:hypothetical protein